MSEFPFTPAQLAWLEDLETAEARGIAQTTGRLVNIDMHDRPIGFCCLGRACEALGIERTRGLYLDHFAGLPDSVVGALLLRDPLGSSNDGQPNLSTLNDGDGSSFAEIAAQLRAYPDSYFTNLD